MKKLKIILIGVLLYSLMGVVLVNSIETTLIPKFKPFGTSTVFADSTNYVTIVGKGLLVYDSVRVGKDLYVGITGGKIYLDTNRQGQIYYDGYNLKIVSTKTGSLDITSGQALTTTSTAANTTLTSGADFLTYIGNGNATYHWYKTTGGTSVELMSLDTITGLIIDPLEANTTMQIQLQGDTASDYDANDNITLNRQTGVLTTKSLTTGANTSYALTWTNSLISASSKVFATIGATASTGAPLVLRCQSGSGSVAITIRNVDDAVALNNTLGVNVLVINSP